MSSPERPHAQPHGQIRQSQVVTTFGPGSLLDLPTQSVIVGGLDTGPDAAKRSTSRGCVEKLKRSACRASTTAPCAAAGQR